MGKIGIANQIMNNIKTINYQQNILDKIILQIIQNMPDMNKFYNNIDKNQNYIQQPKEALYENKRLFYYGKDFFFYVNFILLEKKIYDLLFDMDVDYANQMQLSNYYTDCFFDDGYVFIKLKNEICGLDKFVLEVGKINDDNIFNLEFFLIYNKESNFHEHILYIVQPIGIKNFFNSLIFGDKMYLDIGNLKGEIIGEICPYNEKDNDILNNNSSFSEYERRI